MWLRLAWATACYSMAAAEPVWMCPNCNRPASVCKGTCRRQQR